MENYVEQKITEATWEFWKDDKEMLGSSLFGFAITHWKLDHLKEVEGFKQDYLKKVKLSC